MIEYKIAIKSFILEKLNDKGLSKSEMDFILSKVGKKSNPELKKNETTDLKISKTSEGIDIGKIGFSPNAIPNFVIKQTEQVEKAKEQILSYARKFDVYENGVFLGIFIGKTTKEQFVQIMKEYSSQVIDLKDTAPVYFLSDLSLTVYFDVRNIVKEITLGKHFKGQSARGLRIGESIDRAIELYGWPISQSSIHLGWGRFSIFHNNGVVTYLRLQV